jgi:hypothetical protein
MNVGGIYNIGDDFVSVFTDLELTKNGGKIVIVLYQKNVLTLYFGKSV